MYIIAGSISLFLLVVSLAVVGESWERSEVLPKDLKRTNSRVLLGKYRRGKLYHNFNKHPHMLVAGHTGYGKTNFIKCLLEQLAGEVVLIDLKGGFDYDKVTCTEVREAAHVLTELVENMRQKRTKRVYIILDEAYEIVVPKWAKTDEQKQPYLDCQWAISEIARLGRTFRYSLIYCTQYPTGDVLDRQVKQNMESRIVLRLPTDVASRVALDESGAEDLPAGVAGRGFYKTDYKIQMQCYEWRKGDGPGAKIRDSKIAGNGNLIEIG